MTDLCAQVRSDILQAIEADRLVMPTLPEVALTIRTEASNPNSTAASLARAIGRDAALSARLLKIANSPLLRASRTINDLQMAISRLGVQYSSNLATGLAMQQMFQSSSKAIDQRLRQIWHESTEVAGIALVLTQNFTKLKPDQAMLAGLMHRLGALPILTHAEGRSELLASPALIDRLIEDLHHELGRTILERWEFPPALVEVPERYRDFGRDSSAPDYVDVVMVAVLHSRLDSDHPDLNLDWSTIPAFGKLGLDPDIDARQIEDVSDEMEAAMALLND